MWSLFIYKAVILGAANFSQAVAFVVVMTFCFVFGVAIRPFEKYYWSSHICLRVLLSLLSGLFLTFPFL